MQGIVDSLKIAYLITTVETPEHYRKIVTWTLRSRIDKNQHTLEEVTNSFREAFPPVWISVHRPNRLKNEGVESSYDPRNHTKERGNNTNKTRAVFRGLRCSFVLLRVISWIAIRNLRSPQSTQQSTRFRTIPA